MSDPDRFRSMYTGARPEDLPWFHAEPDEDLVALFDRVADAPGRVLDLGAGPAVCSIHLASRGHEVVAVDAVEEAREMALAIAADRGATVEYIVHDALDVGHLDAFDLIVDRGFLHTLSPELRERWRHAVTEALVPGGHVVVKCFDARPARTWGPPGLSSRDVLEVLGDPERGGLQLLSLERTRWPGDEREHATWTVLARRDAR